MDISCGFKILPWVIFLTTDPRIVPEQYPEHGEMMNRMDHGQTHHMPGKYNGQSSHYVDKRGHHFPPDEV